MDFHVCKTRRGSNPDAVVNCNMCNKPTGPGGLTQNSDQTPGACQGCSGSLNLQICPTTGGMFHMDIPGRQTIQGLRKAISRKLGLPQDRISLLHKERLLKEGTLVDNHITDGSRITLLPNVESGLMSCPPELSVMQALENLSEDQVDEFLTGKSPLTLAMRLGNHMMFLQLQLSTVSPGAKRTLLRGTPASASPSPHRYPSPVTLPTTPPNDTNSSASNNHLQIPPSINSPMVITPPPSPKSPSEPVSPSGSTYSFPVTSLPVPPPTAFGASPKDVTLDPANTPPPSPCYGQKVIPTLPTIQVNDRTIPCSTVTTNSTTNTVDSDTTKRTENDSMTDHLRPCLRPPTPTSTIPKDPEARLPFLNSATLAEAKRNLSMKLKEFSEQAATEKVAETVPAGAVIESMQKLGNGVFSGTFSGTLNPALQDSEGKPKKSVSTIVHILNDLLGARRHRNSAHNRLHNTHQQGAKPTHQRDNYQDDPEKETIRGKVEHLQMMMEERKRRRQARRRRCAAPYTQSRQLTPEIRVNGNDVLMADSTGSDVCMGDSACESSDSQDIDVAMESV